MVLQTSNSSSDGFCWRCRTCWKKVSVRKGSFFSGSKLPLTELIIFIYMWAYEMSTYKDVRRECRFLSDHTIANWRMYLRELCVEHFLRHPQVLGGEGSTVEIDGSLFARRKNNTGRVRRQLWVFGGYEPATKLGFLVTVPSRDAATLIPIIKEYVRPGTTIMLDCWRACDSLESERFHHLLANHKYNLVDPSTSATTNYVENMWQHSKRRNKAECGTHEHMVESCLAEFMWRQKFKNNPLEGVFEQIREIYLL